MEAEDWEPACMWAFNQSQEGQDIATAAETIMGKGTDAKAEAEWLELILAEAHAIARRREIAVVHTEALPPSTHATA